MKVPSRCSAQERRHPQQMHRSIRGRNKRKITETVIVATDGVALPADDTCCGGRKISALGDIIFVLGWCHGGATTNHLMI